MTALIKQAINGNHLRGLGFRRVIKCERAQRFHHKIARDKFHIAYHKTRIEQQQNTTGTHRTAFT